MKVLVACEFSGTVRDAFIRAGHDAVSCDLRPSESSLGPHIQGDVLKILNDGWDMLIGHPECTYLANSGVQHLYLPITPEDRLNKRFIRYKRNESRWQKMEAAAEFFNRIANAPVPYIAVENPIMHGYGIELTGGKASQFVQPYEYGHPETKRTGLRLINLPKLKPTNNVKAEMAGLPKSVTHRVHYMSPGPERQKERSRFFPGIAEAMATQWTQYVKEQTE